MVKMFPILIFMKWEDNWTHQNQVFSDQPTGDAVALSIELFNKYKSKQASDPYHEIKAENDKSKLTKEFVLKSLFLQNIGDFIIYPDNILKSKIIKQDFNENQVKIEIFIETKNKPTRSGKIELTYDWSYYEWELLSIRNIDFK